MYTLDTNAVIYYLKDDHEAAPILEPIFSTTTPLYISSITEVALFGFPKLTAGEQQLLEELLGSLAVIPLDSRIARIAGELRRMYGVRLPDSVIAATALFTGSILITRNVRDFKRIPGLPTKRI